MGGLVAAGASADRPRAARVARGRVERVVSPFAMRLADRMDRRQIDDIEAERRDVRQPRLRALERAVPLASPAGRGGKGPYPGGNRGGGPTEEDRRSGPCRRVGRRV